MPTGTAVDFSGTSLGFDPVPSGIYICEVVEAEDGETGENSKEPGAPKTTWTLSVAEGEFQGRKLFRTTTYSEGGKPFLMELLVATGLYTEEQLRDEGWDGDYEAIIGTQLVADVGQQTWDGKIRNQIKSLKPISAEHLVGATPKKTGFKKRK